MCPHVSCSQALQPDGSELPRLLATVLLAHNMAGGQLVDPAKPPSLDGAEHPEQAEQQSHHHHQQQEQEQQQQGQEQLCQEEHYGAIRGMASPAQVSKAEGKGVVGELTVPDDTD